MALGRNKRGRKTKTTLRETVDKDSKMRRVGATERERASEKPQNIYQWNSGHGKTKSGDRVLSTRSVYALKLISRGLVGEGVGDAGTDQGVYQPQGKRK